LLILTGCASSATVSEEEREAQARTSEIVSNVLFDNNLEAKASYNIRKDGKLVIKFDEDVNFLQYNKVVQTLRANPAIPSVRAEQAGVQVCAPPYEQKYKKTPYTN
jgi:hypothetical protein